MAMNIDFTGKTVLITGAGRGLGKEMAIQFAGCGANVYLGNRKVDQGEETVAELEAMGVRAGFTKCDVAVEEDVEKLIADAVEFGGGKLDVIVNAAGVICLQDLMYIKPEEVERLFSINVGGTVNMLKHGLKVLEGQKSGNFITVSSIAGRDGMNMLQAYSASKAAVTSLTQSAAKMAAPYGVRVNSILPGIIRTAMWERSWTAHGQRVEPGRQEHHHARAARGAVERLRQEHDSHGPRAAGRGHRLGHGLHGVRLCPRDHRRVPLHRRWHHLRSLGRRRQPAGLAG